MNYELKKMKIICHYISEYMGALVLLVAAISLWWPKSFLWIETSTINPMLGVIMFGMGLTLSPQDFRIVLTRPKDILIGCLAQFTVMPLLAWGLTWAFSLPKELALGVILVGCCPGGTASNVITYLAKGDLALSVGMTATSTLLAPLLTPLLVWLMAGTMVDVNVQGMLLSIVYVVIAPILAGLLCQRFLPKITKSVVPYLPAFSSIAIAFVVGIVVSHSASQLLKGGLVVVFVVMLHNLFGLGLGYLIGRALGLEEPKKRAISIEVGMQNSGLASSLATLHFSAYPLATVPGAIFSVWHNISGALIARLYTWKTPPRRMWLSVIFVCLCQFSFSQDSVHIWDGTDIKAKSVTLTPYLASRHSIQGGATVQKVSRQGNTEGSAVIICPGGSYSWHDMKAEGCEVARWLQENGISAFVLKYRVQGVLPYITHSRLLFRGHQHPDMVNDLQQAIQYVREHATEYGVNPHRVGVMGFSAGGHLAMMAAGAEGVSFIAAIYPVVSMSHPVSHKRSRRALLGEYRKYSRRMRDSLSIEKHVPKDCPPVFLVNCKDDPVVKYRNSELLDSALTAQGISHRYIQYRTGGHGFGASATKGTAECRAWKEEFLMWVEGLGVKS